MHMHMISDTRFQYCFMGGSKLFDYVYSLFSQGEEEMGVDRSWQTNTLINQEDTI